MSDDIERRLRDYAAHPAEHGWCPIFPKTLLEAANEIERLRELCCEATNMLRDLHRHKPAYSDAVADLMKRLATEAEKDAA